MLPTEKPSTKDFKNKKGKTSKTPTIDIPKIHINKVNPKVKIKVLKKEIFVFNSSLDKFNKKSFK